MIDYPMVEPPITDYLNRLTDALSPINSIWIFGSRANGRARLDSDWDFFAFANRRVLADLRADNSFYRPDVDLFIVTDADSFECPWPRINEPTAFKRGFLRDIITPDRTIYNFGWEFTGETTATYFDPIGIIQPRIKRQAFRVYAR